jgi:predicted CoA-binding protein
MTKDCTKYFLEGFFSIFKIAPVKTKEISNTDITEYFRKIEEDVDVVFKKLKY